jgi:hypothetical protein
MRARSLSSSNLILTTSGGKFSDSFSLR